MDLNTLWLDANSVWDKHRKAILIVLANIVVLVLLVLGAKAIHKATLVPKLPDAKNAPPEKVIKAMADKRWPALPQTKQREFVRNFIASSDTPTRREATIKAINDLPTHRVEQLKQNVTTVFKENIVEASNYYAKLPARSPQRKAFIKRQVGELEQMHRMFRGRDIAASHGKSGGRRADFARSKLSDNAPEDPGQAYQAYLKVTNPTDRAKIDTYVNDIKQELEGRRNERKQAEADVIKDRLP